jgi:NodT family efflux transporter outer membrane factor (OMF) lipoprotein
MAIFPVHFFFAALWPKSKGAGIVAPSQSAPEGHAFHPDHSMLSGGPRHRTALERRHVAGCNMILAMAGLVAVLSACAPLQSAGRASIDPGERFLPQTTTSAMIGARADSPQAWRTDRSLDETWWRLFRSDVLSRLESEALTANADLKAAEASVRAAGDLDRAHAATRAPNFQLTGGAARARTSGEIASPLSSNALTYTLYSTQLSATLPVDVMGGLRSQAKAARAQADAQACLARAVKINLTASVAQTFILIAGLNSQKDDAAAAVQAARRALTLTKAMNAAGESSETDVAAAEAMLAGLEQLTPSLDRQIRVATDLLAVLIGRRPETMSAPNARLFDLVLPADIPVSVPSEALRRRPDVCAAEAGVRSAAALKDAAVAARLPAFSIGAVGGGQSTELARLLSGGNSLWSIGATATQTLFDGGVLRHRARAADAALEQAVAQHRSVVLSALQSVADALQTTASDADVFRQAGLVASATARSRRIAMAQLEAGQIGRLADLNAEVAERQADLNLHQTMTARELDTVVLFAALGGGLSADGRVEGAHTR